MRFYLLGLVRRQTTSQFSHASYLPEFWYGVSPPTDSRKNHGAFSHVLFIILETCGLLTVAEFRKRREQNSSLPFLAFKMEGVGP
jgi:hypothetical protein